MLKLLNIETDDIVELVKLVKLLREFFQRGGTSSFFTFFFCGCGEGEAT